MESKAIAVVLIDDVMGFHSISMWLLLMAAMSSSWLLPSLIMPLSGILSFDVCTLSSMGKLRSWWFHQLQCHWQPTHVLLLAAFRIDLLLFFFFEFKVNDESINSRIRMIQIELFFFFFKFFFCWHRKFLGDQPAVEPLQLPPFPVLLFWPISMSLKIIKTILID